MKKIIYGHFRAELLLAFVILARSISYVMTKIGLQDMGTFTLLGFRFLTAFLFLLPFGWKRLQKITVPTLIRGLLLGTSFFAIMAAEVSALKTTNASTASFLENTAIIFVPLFEVVIRKKCPRIPVMISTILSLCGVALLTLKKGNFSLTGGEILCLTAAVLYACSIILTDRISKQDDPLTLGILQVGFMGVYSMISAFLFETPHMPNDTSAWGAILILAIVCSGFGFTLQPLAQSKTTSERTGLFCALGTVGAAVSGALILNEQLGLLGLCGMGLVLFAMAFSNMYDRVLH